MAHENVQERLFPAARRAGAGLITALTSVKGNNLYQTIQCAFFVKYYLGRSRYGATVQRGRTFSPSVVQHIYFGSGPGDIRTPWHGEPRWKG